MLAERFSGTPLDYPGMLEQKDTVWGWYHHIMRPVHILTYPGSGAVEVTIGRSKSITLVEGSR